MAPRQPADDRPEDLPPTEAARARRRDHDAAAGARAGMRTGLAKQFKQVFNAQLKRARAAGRRTGAIARPEPPEPDAEAPTTKRGRHTSRADRPEAQR